MSTSSYKASSEAEFPTTLPPYGIWWNQTTFTLHKSLSAVKNLITAKGTNNQLVNPTWSYRTGADGPVKFNQNIAVYELHGTTWQIVYDMKKNAERDKHELWQAAAPTTPQTVSTDEVAAAIASIMGS